MKRLLISIIFLASTSAAYAQQSQSPLTPPALPPAGAAGKSTTLKLGDRAPDFALPNGDGKLVTLSEYTQKSPVVLVFYRGFW